MTPVENVCAELREMGYTPQLMRPAGFGHELVALDYHVKIGRYRGKRFRIGIGFQENAYPEYPPHWICVAALSDTSIQPHSSFRHEDDEWKVFSAPPSDFWDNLATAEKNMKPYFHRHLTRFWDQI